MNIVIVQLLIQNYENIIFIIVFAFIYLLLIKIKSVSLPKINCLNRKLNLLIILMLVLMMEFNNIIES